MIAKHTECEKHATLDFMPLLIVGAKQDNYGCDSGVDSRDVFEVPEVKQCELFRDFAVAIDRAQAVGYLRPIEIQANEV